MPTKNSFIHEIDQSPQEDVVPAAPAPMPKPVRVASVKRKSESLDPPPDLIPIFEAVAAEHEVPVNVLMALAHQESRYTPQAIGPETQYGRAKGMMQYIDETAKNLKINPFDTRQSIDAAARQLKERLNKGMEMPDAVMEHFAGPDRKKWGTKTKRYGEEVIGKSKQIAATLYPEPVDEYAAKQAELDAEEPGRYSVVTPEMNRDMAREAEVSSMEAYNKLPKDSLAKGKDIGAKDVGLSFAKGLTSGVGSGVYGVGEALKLGADAITKPINALTGADIRTANPLVAPSEAIQGVADKIWSLSSDAAQQKLKDSTPRGNLDPSTWSLGDDPSTQGYLLQGSQIMGQAGVLIAMGFARAGTALLGGVGAAMSGGDAAKQGRDTIINLHKEGKLAQESELYRELIKNGVPEQDALTQTADAAAQWAFTLAVPAGVAGGVLTGKVVSPAASGLVPAAKNIGIGSVAGGGQEVVEGIAGRSGENIGAGMNQDVTQDAFGNLVLGTLGEGTNASIGSGIKAVRNLLPGQQAQAAEQPLAPAEQPDQDAQPAAPNMPTQEEAQGPLLTALKEAGGERITVSSESGQVSGFVDEYLANDQGRFAVRMLGDDGQVYNFTSEDNVSVQRGSDGLLSKAIEAVAPDIPQDIEAELANIEAELANEVALPDINLEDLPPVEPEAPQVQEVTADLQPPQDVNDSVTASEPLEVSQPTVENTQTRARYLEGQLDYLKQQAKVNGWSKALTQARKEVEAELYPQSVEAAPVEVKPPKAKKVKPPAEKAPAIESLPETIKTAEQAKGAKLTKSETISLLTKKLKKAGVDTAKIRLQVEEQVGNSKSKEYSDALIKQMEADYNNLVVKPLFSRKESGGLSVEKAINEVNRVTKKWSAAPEIVVVNNMDDPRVPDALRQENAKQVQGGAKGGASGAFHDGVVYVFSDNNKSEKEVAETVIHEAVGHYGIRETFGDEMAGILQDIDKNFKQDVDAKLASYGLEESERMVAAEEVLVDLANKSSEIGVVKRAVAAIRTWLRRTIPALKDIPLTKSEVIRNYILPARKFLETGRVRPALLSAVQKDNAIKAAAKLLKSKKPTKGMGDIIGDIGHAARLIVHPRTIASIHKEFVAVYQAALSQIKRRDELVAELGDKFIAYNDLPQESKEKVNAILELGRLTSTVYTKAKLKSGIKNEGVTRYTVNEESGPVIKEKPINAAISKVGQVISLTDAEIKAYTDLRSMFDSALEKMLDQTLADLGLDIKDKGKSASKSIRGLIESEMEALKRRAESDPKTYETLISVKNRAAISIKDKEVISILSLVDKATSAKEATEEKLNRVAEETKQKIKQVIETNNELNAAIEESGKNIEKAKELYIKKVKEIKYSRNALQEAFETNRETLRAAHRAIREKLNAYLLDVVNSIYATKQGFTKVDVMALRSSVKQKIVESKDFEKAELSEIHTRYVEKRKILIEGHAKDDDSLPGKLRALLSEKNAERLEVTKKHLAIRKELGGYFDTLSQEIDKAVLAKSRKRFIKIKESIVAKIFESRGLEKSLTNEARIEAYAIDNQLKTELETLRKEHEAEIEAIKLKEKLKLKELRTKDRVAVSKLQGYLESVENRKAAYLHRQNLLLQRLDVTLSSVSINKLKYASDIVNEIEQAKRSGYVPFSRYGDYVVSVTETIDRPKFKEVEGGYLVYNMPDSYNEGLSKLGAEKTKDGWVIPAGKKNAVIKLGKKTIFSTKVSADARDYLKEKSAKNLMDIPSIASVILDAKRKYVKGNPRREVSYDKVKELTTKQQINIEDLNALAENAGIESEQWDAVMDKLSDAMKAKGFRRHFFHADNVPGYTTDFERSMADYLLGMSGYLSRREHSKQWQTAIDGTTKKPRLHAYATDYRQEVNSPREEFALVRQIGFFSYIAGVFASAFANLTQLPIMTLPTLAQLAPTGVVVKQLSIAARDVMKMLGNPKKTGIDLFDLSKAPKDVKEIILKANDEGAFIPLETFHLMMTARQQNIGARKATKAFNRTSEIVATPFTFAERLNRLVTFIAAARIARLPETRNKAQSLAKNELFARTLLDGDWSEQKFAEWAIDESQFRMGKSNRPTIMRGYGAAIMQFKGFLIQTFEAWYRMASMHGNRGKLAAAASLAMLLNLGGLWAFPGAEDIRKAAEGIYTQATGKDFDAKTELREWVAKTSGSVAISQIVTKGITYPLGVDLTRVGMGSIAPDSATGAAGIPFDLFVGRPVRAINKSLAGDQYGAVAEFTPNFIKNFIVAGGYAVDGVRDKTGSRVLTPDQLQTSDIAMKALGFRPSIVSDAQDYEYAKKREETEIDRLKRRYVGKIAKLVVKIEKEKSPEKIAELEGELAEVYREIDEHNASSDKHIQLSAQSIQKKIKSEIMGIQSGFGSERKDSRENIEDLRGVILPERLQGEE